MVFQGTWEGAEVPGLPASLFGTKVEPVCADLRDTFQMKRAALSSLRDTCILIIWANSCSDQRGQLLLFSLTSPYMPLTGVKALEESSCHKGPGTSSSVHQ